MSLVDDAVATPQTAGGLRSPDAPRGAVPCAARPGSPLVHPDGPCECFFGGPPPVFG
jgi:hypothetical protein